MSYKLRHTERRAVAPPRALALKGAALVSSSVRACGSLQKICLSWLRRKEMFAAHKYSPAGFTLSVFYIEPLCFCS